MQNPSKIMVVEDESMLLQAISKKLQTSGFETVSCTSGAQALEYLHEIDERPDLIWLDYYLKDMTALDVIAAIKKSGEWANIPIVIVSNTASPDKVNSLLTLGVEKYFLKAEYRLDEIVQNIKNLIKDAS